MEKKLWKIPDRDKNNASAIGAVTPMYMPDQLPGSDPGEDWYYNYALYIFNLYNQPTQNVSLPFSFGALGTILGGTNVNDYWSLPANRMLYYTTYGIGMQPNVNFNHEVSGFGVGNDGVLGGGKSGSAVMTKGQKVRTLMDKMAGSALGELTDIKIGADPLSPNAKNKAEEAAEKKVVEFIISKMMSAHVKKFQKEPDPNQEKFNNIDEIKDWKEQKFKDHLADVDLAIAKDIWARTEFIDDALMILRYGAQCGVSSTEIVVENGYVNKVLHPSWNTVIDTNFDDDFNKKGRLWGVAIPMTLTDIFSKYDELGPMERNDLNEIAMSGDMQSELNAIMNNNSFYWWGGQTMTTPFYHDFTATVARCYWIGTEIIKGKAMDTVYTATVIGNRYMIRYGKCDNILEDPYRPYKVKLPVKVWHPNMQLGIFQSFVGRINDIQDKIDFYQLKIDETVAAAKGKNYIMYLDKLGAKKVSDVVSEFASFHITGITSSGDYDNPIDRQRLVEAVDMTLDPNVMRLVELRKEWMAEMELYVGQTKLTLGEQTKYMGQKAYSGNMEQSATGTACFYASYMTHICSILQDMVNVKRNIYASGQMKEEALTVIGKRGLNLLKALGPEKYCQNHGIFLKLNDNVAEEDKKQLAEFLKSLVNQPNHGITPGNWLDLVTTPTKSGRMDKYKAMEADMIERAQADMKARMEADVKKNADNNQKEKDLAALQSSTQLQKVKMQTDAKLKVQDKKQGKENEPPPLVSPINNQAAPPPTQPAQTQPPAETPQQ